MGVNLVFRRVSVIFKAIDLFHCSEGFSAPKGARKCLSPTNIFVIHCNENLVKHL